jgi:hypothetical protein
VLLSPAAITNSAFTLILTYLQASPIVAGVGTLLAVCVIEKERIITKNRWTSAPLKTATGHLHHQ